MAVASFSADAALIDNGGGLIYDDVLDITWAQPDALRTWDAANTWVAGLTLGGVSGWRLPYISVAAGAGPFTGDPVRCRPRCITVPFDNELAYMRYQALQAIGEGYSTSITISGDPDLLALFPTLQSERYWTGTEYDSAHAWSFSFKGGGGFFYTDWMEQHTELLTWAVHPGNVGAVPVPAAVWLFGFGLLGLIGVARRKKA